MDTKAVRATTKSKSKIFTAKLKLQGLFAFPRESLLPEPYQPDGIGHCITRADPPEDTSISIPAYDQIKNDSGGYLYTKLKSCFFFLFSCQQLRLILSRYKVMLSAGSTALLQLLTGFHKNDGKGIVIAAFWDKSDSQRARERWLLWAS